MTEQKIIYVPAGRDKLHLEWFDIDYVMQFVDGKSGETKICDFGFPTSSGEADVQVNMGTSRYHVFKRDKLTCACCGIKATTCWLDLDKQNSTPEKPVYHFNFYAECGDKGKTFNILFEKNHIISLSTGGKETESDLSNY